MKTKRNRDIVEYVQCNYCDAAIDATDPTVTHREAGDDLWTCPECTEKLTTHAE